MGNTCLNCRAAVVCRHWAATKEKLHELVGAIMPDDLADAEHEKQYDKMYAELEAIIGTKCVCDAYIG